MAASDTSPLVNPAFVIANWDEAKVAIALNGTTLTCGKDLCVGFRQTPTGSDLIVWVKTSTFAPTAFVFLEKSGTDDHQK